MDALRKDSGIQYANYVGHQKEQILLQLEQDDLAHGDTVAAIRGQANS